MQFLRIIKLRLRYFCQLILRLFVPVWSALNAVARRRSAIRSTNVTIQRTAKDIVSASSGGTPGAANGGGGNGASSRTGGGGNHHGKETLPTPKQILFSRDHVLVGWKAVQGRKWQVGTGMVNMGNTCYLNSTLQALFHVPAIANWLYMDAASHREQCDDSSGSGNCIICAMAKTLIDSQSNLSAIKPYLVYSKLRLVCKHLVPGRQEDAHEFLRYLVEAMEKSYLGRFKNSKDLDQYSKETTPLNQILGGYLRSEVKCLSCAHISTTFQHFEDLLLDIRKASSIDEALGVYFAREPLEEMGYKCEACKKRVAATKQFSLERAPFALCIQLKRFSMLGSKINKHVEIRPQLDLTPYSSSVLKASSMKLAYKLVSMVTHLGNTQHCGHYTAIGNTESGGYYVFDDSSVRPISMQGVVGTNAYILFYELESSASLQNGIKPTATSTATLTSMGVNGISSALGGSSGGNGSVAAAKGASNLSPLRVLGVNSNSGGNGGIFPSKLEQKQSLIGPLLPSAAGSGSATAPSTPTSVPNGMKEDFRRGSSISSTCSTLSSSPTATKQSPRSISPAASNSSTPNASSHKGSGKFGGFGNHVYGKMGDTAHTSNGADGHVKSKFGTSNTSNMGKLAGTSSAKVSNGNGTTNHASYEKKTSALPSMPKLCHSPAVHSGPSMAVPSKSKQTISLVPYEADGASDDEDSLNTHALLNGSANSTGLSNGNSVRNKSYNDDEIDEDEKSPSTLIKSTKAGLWKMADNLATPQQSSVPNSSSTSNASSPALSSNGSSPSNSGGSSPTNYHHHHNHQSTTAKARDANGTSTNGYNHSKGNAGFQGNGKSDAVSHLLKYSHRGYGAPVMDWHGRQTAMEKVLASEKREERKRQVEDDRDAEMDRGRTKKVKTHFPHSNGSSGGRGTEQQNGGGGYNPFQQYQNQQSNGDNNGTGMRKGHNGNNNNNNNFKRNNGYNKFHRNYSYHNGNGGNNNNNNNNGGGGGGGGGRHGGFRHGRQNRNGFHSKSHHPHHHHHQRDNSSGGINSGGTGGGSNFYSR